LLHNKTTGVIELRALPTTPAMGAQLDGVGSADYCGTSVAGGFDFNKDGYDDVIIGAPGYVGVTAIPFNICSVVLLFNTARL
jgi:FG-GAP repeat